MVNTMKMEIRRTISPGETKKIDSQRLREEYLIEDLMLPGKIRTVYTYHDRLIIGGAVPAEEELVLETHEALKSDFFLERREAGILLISGQGSVRVDGKEYVMDPRECLYAGRGTREVIFSSTDAQNPAHFYFVSSPAHTSYPVSKKTIQDADVQAMGSAENCNERVLHKYIHPDGIKSCQLMMGFTELKTGSIWNTMPPHLHERRMEAYLYFDLPDDERVWHFMGEPHETRHLLVANEQAVISPAWSIHSGAGTSNYRFVWAMAGENQSFADMDAVEPGEMK